MLTHYLKISFRNLLKNKTQTAISIFGLIVAFSCLSLSAIWINYETSYDTQHPNAENIYCLYIMNKNNPGWQKSLVFGKDGEFLKNNYPEIQTKVNIGNLSRINIQNEDGFVVECHGTDAELFDMFSMHFILGDKQTAFNQPNSVVLNETTAKKLFGSIENAIGKSLKAHSLDDELCPDYVVTGVIKDLKHSNIKNNALIPMTKYERDNMFHEYADIFFTYILLRENINKQEFFEKLEQPFNEHGGYYKLVPIPEIQYKYSYAGLNRVLPFNFEYIIILVIISCILFFCAILNHISLFISYTYNRLRDLGLRKALGASSLQLYLLLITDFVVSLLIAFLLGVCLIEILRPVLENITQIETEFTRILNMEVVIITGAILLAVLMVSYPLWNISTSVVKKNMLGKLSIDRQRLQRAFVTLQIIIGVFFLLITTVMFKQMNFLYSSDLGINIKNVIKITPNVSYIENFKKKADIIVNDLRNDESIIGAFKQGRDFFLPYGNKQNGSQFFNWEGKNPDEPDYTISWIESSSEFADFFDLQMVQGRFFSKTFPSDSNKIVINQKFADILREPVIGKILTTMRGNYTYEIIGVIDNLQDRSLKYETMPLVMELTDWTNFIYARYVDGVEEKTLEYINTILRKHGIDNYRTEFMENTFKDFTKADSIMMRIIAIVAGACLIISVFGVYSLTLYSMKRRQREVAIRKVMGASVKDIIRMFFKEYIWLVMVASIIALPPAYYIMDKWLRDYANRIGIAWWLIAGIIITILIIVISTVLRQIIKAANSNPADVIKYE